MRKPTMFHRGSRAMQRHFKTTALANRIVERLASRDIDAKAKITIEDSLMFFLATADAQGRPDCSYKGGLPGFVRVLGKSELVFPVYDGNGMYKSLGNILVNPSVGLLFMDFEKQKRLRVNGKAKLLHSRKMLALFPGAELVVSVRTNAVFPNCPRYIHSMKLRKYSEFAPRGDYRPPEPAWKRMPEFRNVLPTTAAHDNSRPVKSNRAVGSRLAKARRRTALS